VGKYFKYAIGEIVLVVVGILFALQINNWNKDRKNANLERQYLERLIHDLQSDTAYFSQLINEAKMAVSHLDSF
jgi:hypothetical protein